MPRPSPSATGEPADSSKLPSRELYDLVVVGGGSAGYSAARTAAELGAKTALIEGGKQIGGLCILRGCMPSKALLESAHRWHELKRAREFGLVAKAVRVDLKCVQNRKRHLVDDFAAYRRKQIKKGSFTFLRGKAKFLDAKTVLVSQGRNEQKVEARTFILATGSVVQKVDIAGLQEAGYWTSDEALEAEKLPQSLVVLGGGIVAMELGQFFSRVGTHTTILQRSQSVLRSFDGDVSAELVRAFTAEKLEVQTGVTLLRVESVSKGKERGKRVIYEWKGKKREIVADEILCALGRRPALDGLNLDAIGIATSGGKMTINHHQQSTELPHIFAAGDIAGPYEVVHIAIAQAEIAARNACRYIRGASRDFESIDYRLKTIVAFTDPQLALLGLTEAELKARKIDYVAATAPFDDHGKSMIGGHLHGFVKLLAEPTRGEILGAQIIGPDASNLIHELIVLMRYHGTAEELASIPHYHPTLSEIITYPAEEIAHKVRAGKLRLKNSPALQRKTLRSKPAVSSS